MTDWGHGTRADPGSSSSWLNDIADHTLLHFAPGGHIIMLVMPLGAGDNESSIPLAFSPDSHICLAPDRINSDRLFHEDMFPG